MQKEVDISMHLHDGSGYWRPTYESKILNQYRWGNCSVVDQSELQGAKYGNIESFATQIVHDINEHILDPLHTYHVHNTHTKVKHDEEQLKALTFYSLSIGKPALTNEASKELSVSLRVYYHLLALESLLAQLHITFERDFELEPSQVAYILQPPSQIEIEQNITLPLDSIRPVVRNFPFPKDKEAKHLQLESESRVMGFVKNKRDAMELKYGFRTISTFLPEWRHYDTSLKTLQMIIDDKERSVSMGSIINVKDSLEFLPIDGYRVNMIGYIKPGDTSSLPNEVGIRVSKQDFIPRFSLDRKAQIYRVEVYKGESLSGMIMIAFNPEQAKGQEAKNPKVDLAETHSSQTAANTPSASKQVNPSHSQKENPNIRIVKSPKGVNLRLMPSIQGKIMAKLPQGTRVEIIESGTWSKIIWNGMTGFAISTSLMSEREFDRFYTEAGNWHKTQAIDATTQNLASMLQKKTSSKARKARVKVNAAYVRLAPSIESKIIAKTPLGREMEIIEDGDEWVRIYYQFRGREIRNIDGYIAKRLLHIFE